MRNNNYFFLHIYLENPNKCVIFVIEIKTDIIMFVTGSDAIRYIEDSLKIRLETSFNIKTDKYEITAKLILDNKVISEDKIEFEAI